MRGRGRAALALLGVGLASAEAQASWSEAALGETTVHVYRPTERSPVGDGRALMVVLHGCTQEATALREHGNLEETADALGVVMAVPAVPGGGVVAGCWDYYGSAHTRTSKHSGPLLDIVDGLASDPDLDIDPDQVYAVGLSSGGGQALVLGCLAPDVFAGIGAIAAPALGTGVADGGTVATTAEQAATLCETLAASHTDALQTQVGFTFLDSADFVVADGYNPINAAMFGAVMSVGLDAMDATAVDFTTLPGVSPTGMATEYADAGGVRVARLDSTSGVGHAWPAGSGANPGPLSFVSGDGVNIARYAADFFAAHNPRVADVEPPDDGTSSGGEGTTTGPSAGTETTAGTTSMGVDSSSTSGSGSPPEPAASSTGAVASSGGSSGAQEPGATSSGGCRTGGGGTAGWALLLLLGGLRRRRAVRDADRLAHV